MSRIFSFSLVKWVQIIFSSLFGWLEPMQLLFWSFIGWLELLQHLRWSLIGWPLRVVHLLSELMQLHLWSFISWLEMMQLFFWSFIGWNERFQWYQVSFISEGILVDNWQLIILQEKQRRPCFLCRWLYPTPTSLSANTEIIAPVLVFLLLCGMQVLTLPTLLSTAAGRWSLRAWSNDSKKGRISSYSCSIQW